MNEQSPTGEGPDADARMIANLTASFMHQLEADGWPPGAVLAGVHSGAVARAASELGPDFAAALCDKAGDELRGAVHG